jgi:DNA-binding CsgD family transcriptional regulator
VSEDSKYIVRIPEAEPLVASYFVAHVVMLLVCDRSETGSVVRPVRWTGAKQCPVPQSRDRTQETGRAMPQPPGEVDRARSDGVPPLTERDLEVLRLLAAGRSTAQMAVAMSVSTNTVRTRIRRIRTKFNVLDRETVLAAARDRGVI